MKTKPVVSAALFWGAMLTFGACDSKTKSASSASRLADTGGSTLPSSTPVA